MNNNHIDILLKEVKRHSRKAQEELYHYTYQNLLGTVMRFTKNREEADWVFNIGMLRIFKNIGKTNPTSYDAWATSILKNACIDHYRSNKKHNEHKSNLEVENYQHVSVDINNALLNLDAEYIYKLIQSLPEKDRMVFSLHAIEGHKHAEIGKMLDISANTSKWYLARAKSQLSKAINSIHSTSNQAQ